MQQALDAWLKEHPLARGVALRDENPIFVRIGRHGARTRRAVAEAVARIVGRAYHGVGVPGRLSHPQALRAYYGTDLRTNARYASP